MQKLTEIIPNKYDPSSFICKCNSETNAFIEIVIIENDTTNKLIKALFLSSYGSNKRGDIIWRPYDYFNEWTILKETKASEQRPILS